ncbi:unannotated protein [freshwater metagenome]|uniref:Unannotated protein n=1 Tax=freshwater metagenome TaxID=449393 RepID=A0A6J6WSZ4_9ZZZZ
MSIDETADPVTRVVRSDLTEGLGPGGEVIDLYLVITDRAAVICGRREHESCRGIGADGRDGRGLGGHTDRHRVRVDVGPRSIGRAYAVRCGDFDAIAHAIGQAGDDYWTR